LEKKFFLFFHLVLDLGEDGLDNALFCHKVFCWEDHDLIEVLKVMVGEWLDARDALQLISKKLEPKDGLRRARPDLERITLDQKHARAPLGYRPSELDHHELTDDIFEDIGLADFESEALLLVLFDFSDAVDTGHGCDDDDVFSSQERLGGGVTQAVDLFIDGGFFFDIGACFYDEGFGLVVVIVRDKIVHRIVWEKFFEFLRELGSERLVVRDDERGFLHIGDNIRHGKGLARSRHPEERLKTLTRLESVRERGDGFGLVTSRRIWRVEAKKRHKKSQGVYEHKSIRKFFFLTNSLSRPCIFLNCIYDENSKRIFYANFSLSDHSTHVCMRATRGDFLTLGTLRQSQKNS